MHRQLIQFMITIKELPSELACGARQHRYDLGFVTIFLILFGAVFGFFRAYPVQNVYLTWAITIVASIVAMIWISPNITMPNHKPKRKVISFLFSRDLIAIVTFALAVFTLFYPLMVLHFDTGTDLSVAFGVDKLWFAPWAVMNRPLAGLGPFIAMLITPGSIGGFFIFNLMFRFATAALIYSILRILFPYHWRLSLSVGLLYIVNPAEMSRFNLWAIYYQTALLFLVAACYLLIRSYYSGSKLGLTISCILLSMCCLQYEQGYPLAAAAPLLLLILPRRSYFVVWLTFWYGTITIFAVRFVTYLILTPQPYQRVLFSQWGESPKSVTGQLSLMLHNLITQMVPIFRMISDTHRIFDYMSISALIFCGTFIVLWVLLQNSSLTDRPQSLLYFILAGFICAALGIIVYLPFPITTLVPDYAKNPTLRYQYFAGPGQALFWGAVIGLLTSFINGPIAKRTILSILIAFLCTSASVSGLSYQLSGGVLNPYYRYDTASRVLQQIDQNLPLTRPGDLIFLEIPDTDRSPLGWEYTGYHWACRLFGIPMTQGRIKSDGQIETRLFSYAEAKHVPGPVCSRVHHFRVSEGGNVDFVGTITYSNVEVSKCQNCILTPYPRQKGLLPFITKTQ